MIQNVLPNCKSIKVVHFPRSHCPCLKLNFQLPLLVNCIWYTVTFCILEFWPYVLLSSERRYSTILHNTTAGCGDPISPSRGSIDNFQSAAEGATVTYSCSPGLVPRTQMSAVCTNMTWRPDTATLQCREPGEYCM